MVPLRACSRDSRHEEGSGDGTATCKHRPRDQDHMWPVRRGSDSHPPGTQVKGFRDNYLHDYLQWAQRHCPFIETRVTMDHTDRYPPQSLSPSNTLLQTAMWTRTSPPNPYLAFYSVQHSSWASRSPRAVPPLHGHALHRAGGGARPGHACAGPTTEAQGDF